MPQKSYPYSSIIIKAKEPKILGNDKISKLLASETAVQAAGLLMEWGYGGLEIGSPYEYERLISREMKETYEFVQRISPDPDVTGLFFLRFDYHNLKVFLKSEESGVGANEYNLVNAGTFDLPVLLNAVREKNYGSLTVHMKRALAELDKTFSMTQDISLIGVTLDSAYAQEVDDRIRNKDGFIKKYFQRFFDLENVLMMLRAREAKLSKDLFLRALLPGGAIRKSSLENAYDLPNEDLKAAIAKGQYAEGIAAGLDDYFASGAFYLLEKYRDDTLLKTAGEEKNDLFSIAPVVYYLIQKEREAKAVRMAMTAKLNDIKTEQMQKILVEV